MNHDNQNHDKQKQANQPRNDSSQLQWCWHRLSEMHPAQLYDMLALREAIFVVEQKCIYQELDGRDATALHLVVTRDEDVGACLRLLPPGGPAVAVRIGRVAVCVDWRQRGIATSMVKMAIRQAEQTYPESDIILDAQTYLKAFYEALGFRVDGDEFLEDGIPHIPMKLTQNSG